MSTPDNHSGAGKSSDSSNQPSTSNQDFHEVAVISLGKIAYNYFLRAIPMVGLCLLAAYLWPAHEYASVTILALVAGVSSIFINLLIARYAVTRLHDANALRRASFVAPVLGLVLAWTLNLAPTSLLQTAALFSALAMAAIPGAFTAVMMEVFFVAQKTEQ